MDNEIFYREVLHWRQFWLWLIVGPVTLLTWYAAYRQFIVGRPLGSNPPTDGSMIVTLALFGVGLPLAFLVMRLTVEVTERELRIRYFPFHLSFRHFEAHRITKCKARTYSPLLEYGGWGLRYGFKGWAYTTGGHKGVQIELDDGTRMLIGSNRPDDLVRAIRRASTSAPDEPTERSSDER